MRFVGVIAEYDPFHNGHAAQLAALRRAGAAHIAVCLSAGATQRGQLPMFPDAVRTAAALQNGADLVVALPAPYACQSAEGFAAAGVALLTALGCDTLAFGAETPDTALLQTTAQTLLGEAFAAALRRELDKKLPFAAARAAAAEAVQPGAGALLQNPNDILAVEYCKAIAVQRSPLAPLALPRVGAAHGAAIARRAGPGSSPAIASGAALRALAAERGTGALEPYVPPAALALYVQAADAGQLPDPVRVSTAILARLRGQTPQQLATVRGMREGLEYRLAAAVQRSATLEELYKNLAAKRYPHARLRRLVLDAALGVPADLGTAPPPYLHLLGAKKAALPLLKNAALPAGTALADLAKSGPAAQQTAALHAAAVDLAALCRQTPAPAGLAFTQKPFIL